MPMDFPDMHSLEDAASIHNFRSLNVGETELQYRQALADHVSSRDFIESEEIRTGHGWNKFTEEELEEFRKNPKKYEEQIRKDLKKVRELKNKEKEYGRI